MNIPKEKIEEIFAKHDKDNSGYITQAEVNIVVKEMCGTALPEQAIQKITEVCALLCNSIKATA